jgi:hypothetical protein
MNFDGLEPHWWWLLAAALLALIEIVLPGVFSIWVAGAAALTALIVFGVDLPLAFQLALFALLALAAVYAGRHWYERNPVASPDPLLNDRAARLIGQSVEVVTAIRGGEGRVKVGDGVWPARGPDAEEGARVRIVSAEGGCLRVEPEAPSRLPGA